MLAGCCNLQHVRHLSQSDCTRLETQSVSVSTLDSRYARMSRGVNLHGWFAGNDKLVADDQHRLTFINEVDVERIKNVGITNVRLCLSPDRLFDGNDPSQFKDQKVLSSLNSAVKMLLDADLSVTLVLFPNDAFKERLFRDPEFVHSFAIFWAALARNFKHVDPDYLFLEIINEPNFIRFAAEFVTLDPDDIEKSAAEKWGAVQEELLRAIRNEAPEHTIVLTCDNWSKIKNLVTMKPADDSNVVYTVHIYDPYAFSHQGAEWDARVSGVSGLYYPTDLSNCKIIKEKISPRSREIIETYCQTRWHRKRIERQIKSAVLWAKRHKVRLAVGEFGVYPRHVPPEQAAKYLRDVRTVIEKYGIAWCAWEYVIWLDRLQSSALRDSLGLD